MCIRDSLQTVQRQAEFVGIEQLADLYLQVTLDDPLLGDLVSLNHYLGYLWLDDFYGNDVAVYLHVFYIRHDISVFLILFFYPLQVVAEEGPVKNHPRLRKNSAFQFILRIDCVADKFDLPDLRVCLLYTSGNL